MKKCVVKNCENKVFSGMDVCTECLGVLESIGIGIQIQNDLKQFRVEDEENDQETLSAVVYPRICNSEIVWYGYIGSRQTPLFNEISGKTRSDVIINLHLKLGVYINRLMGMRRKIEETLVG